MLSVKTRARPFSASVYVSNGQSAGLVAAFGADPDGSLTALTPSTVPAVENPTGIAVGADGRSVYVVNQAGTQANSRISQFAAGPGGALTPLTPATVATGYNPRAIAVSPDGASAYVTTLDAIWQYSVGAGGALSPKAPASVPTIQNPYGLAVSPNGRNLYVASEFDNSVSQYAVAADGTLSPLSPAKVAAGGRPEGIAVSPDGHSVYAANSQSGTVSQYTVGTGGALSPMTPATVAAGANATAIAVGADSRSVYVGAGGGRIFQYAAGPGGALSPGTPASVPTGGTTTERVFGIAVSGEGTSLYAAARFGAGTSATGSLSQLTVRQDGMLERKTPPSVSAMPGWGLAVSPLPIEPAAPDAVAPVAVTGGASGASGSAASLAGSVSPGGAPASYTFEYGTSPAFGSITPPVSAGSGTSAVPVSAALAGLQPGVTYYYRLVATNTIGTSLGAVRTFDTAPAWRPTSRRAPRAITASGVRLAGTVNARGSQTAFAFEYGTTTAFGSLSAVDSAG